MHSKVKWARTLTLTWGFGRDGLIRSVCSRYQKLQIKCKLISTGVPKWLHAPCQDIEVRCPYHKWCMRIHLPFAEAVLYLALKISPVSLEVNLPTQSTTLNVWLLSRAQWCSIDDLHADWLYVLYNTFEMATIGPKENLASIWQDSIKTHKYPAVRLFRVRRICHSFVPLFGLFTVHCAVRAAFAVNKPWMNFGIVVAIRVTTEEEREDKTPFLVFHVVFEAT